MTPRDVCIVLALLVLLAVGIGTTIVVHEMNETLNDSQCARMGYSEGLELWGLKWCVRMSEGKLVGVQVEGGN